MATTYTENYNLGMQKDHSDKFDMDVITDNMEKIDEALAGKQDTLTPTQLAAINSGITTEKVEQIEDDRAALVELVDGGSKSLLPITATSRTLQGYTYTINTDGTIDVTGNGSSTTVWFQLNSSVSLKAGKYVLSGGISTSARVIISPTTTLSDAIAVSEGEPVEFTLNADTNNLIYAIRVPRELSDVNFHITPMLCTQAAWDISQTYQPYRKDLAELTVDSDEDRAALVEIVDSGAKNILDLTKATEVVKADELSYTLAADGTLTVTWTADLSINGKTINFKGFPYKAGTYILSGAQLDGSSTAVRADVREGSTAVVMDYGQPPTPFELPSNGYNYVIRVQAPAGSAAFKPMICTKAAWDISQTYQPYRPSYQELYERVVALENH